MPDDPGDDTGFPAPEALEKGPLVRFHMQAATESSNKEHFKPSDERNRYPPPVNGTWTTKNCRSSQ